MKRPFPFPFPLLFPVVFLLLLFLRSAVLPACRRRHSPSPDLLALSLRDPAAPALRADISDLLQADVLSSDAVGGKFRTLSLWRWIGADESVRPRSLARIRLPVGSNPRYPPDRKVIKPLFRETLAAWARKHQEDVSSSVMSELIPLIKKPLEDFHSHGKEEIASPYNTCAVVGNSGILLGSSHGEAIDGHELVIRLNNARVSGYERDVGAKTSLSFVNSNVLHLCTRRPGCHCHPYGENVPIAMYVCQPRHFLDYVVCNSSHKAPLIITDPRFDNLCARITKYYSLKRFTYSTGLNPTKWNSTHDETTFHYSSGFQAVMLALGMCNRVSVFGFGRSNGAKHHYHTNQKAELDLHDYEAEYMIYRDLIQQPEIIPFLDGFRVPPLVFHH